MLDQYRRKIDYLRVSVTDRCNYRCGYCMPAGGIPLKPAQEILSYERIRSVVREAAELGVQKVRLTGGEPLVRKGIEHLVSMLASLPRVEELCLTTNGSRLAELAELLAESGLDRVNVSIDSLIAERYAKITGGGNLRNVLRGVDAALANGLGPVKVNMVLLPETTAEEVTAMRQFCDKKGMPLQRISLFHLQDGKESHNTITAERPPRCEHCNRLRLTSDGFLKPCLFSEQEVKVAFDDIRGSLIRAVLLKPKEGTKCSSRTMHQIGG